MPKRPAVSRRRCRGVFSPPAFRIRHPRKNVMTSTPSTARNKLMQIRRLLARVAIWSLVPLLSVSLSGCRWLLSNFGPVPVVVAADFFVLAWDSDDPQPADQSSSVDHYNVYYRSIGAVDWVPLHATEDETPETIIRSSALDFGSYEFAVEEVYNDGRTSELHSSSDFAAWPPGGWYVVWRAP